jgi:IS5 family transposase
MSFLVMEALERIRESHLLRVHDLIEWGRLSYVLGNLDRSGYGPKGYDPIGLVKGLILQAWHGLSDPGLEEALGFYGVHRF